MFFISYCITLLQLVIATPLTYYTQTEMKKHNPKKRFSIISNTILQDKNLSGDALKIILYILSHSENLKIIKEAVRKNTGLGTYKFENAWKEAIHSGYLLQIKQRINNKWVYDYEIDTEGKLTTSKEVNIPLSTPQLQAVELSPQNDIIPPKNIKSTGIIKTIKPNSGENKELMNLFDVIFK